MKRLAMGICVGRECWKLVLLDWALDVESIPPRGERRLFRLRLWLPEHITKLGVAKPMSGIYSGFSVKLNRKIPQAAFIAALILLGAGCSGINVSKSVSPATFLLPGLLKADPPPAKPDGVLPADVPLPGSPVERAFNVALAQ